jgi:hypothetical protein
MNSGTRRKTVHWLFLMSVCWGIPALLFLIALVSLARLHFDRETEQAFQGLEEKLEKVVEQVLPVEYFSEKLDTLYRTNLEGMFARREMVESVIREFLKGYPEGLMNVFVFDSHGKHIPALEEGPEAEKLFELIQNPWTVPLTFDLGMFESFFRIAPSPELMVKMLKGRPGRVVEISNNSRGTWGFFQFSPRIQQGRVAGILVLINRQAFSQAHLLGEVLGKRTDGFFGHWEAGKEPVAYGNAPPELVRQVHGRYWLAPGNRLTYDGRLLVFRRLDMHTTLFGGQSAPVFRWVKVGLGLAMYLPFSWWILITSWRRMVRGDSHFFPVRRKGLVFFGLGFGLPFAAAGLLAALYLDFQFVTLRDDHRSRVFETMTQIDTGFEEELQKRLLRYRRFMKQLGRCVTSPDRLVKELGRHHLNGEFDIYYLVASDSGLLGESRYFSSEIRRHLDKPLPERLKVFSTWVERGFIPSKFQVEKMTLAENRPKELFPPMWEMDRKLLTFITQSGNVNMQDYNRLHGISIAQRESASDLAFAGIMESEGKSLFNAVKSSKGDFIVLEGTGEYSKTFVDVLPGPTREAWYSLYLYHDLLLLERDYLSKVFARLASTSSPMAIHALSFHPISPGFPDLFSFPRFARLLRQVESTRSFKVTLATEIDGTPFDACVLTCSFLKRYYLVSLTPEVFFQESYRRQKFRVGAFLAGLGLIGAGLVWLLARNFFGPVQSLRFGLEAMEKKQYDFRLPMQANDEWGSLALSFNKALAHLKEMELAGVVQATILPDKAVRVGRYEIFGVNVMTQGVGGDYFDFLPLGGGMLAVVLGDVSGHGISAALVAAMAKAGFSILCRRYPEEPEKVLERMNREFLEQLNRAKMMTGFLGILDYASDRLICANAGQCYPALLKPGEPASFLRFPSNPLGVRKKATFSREHLVLGDAAVVFYSDGIVEAFDESGRMFGYERFSGLLQEIISLPEDEFKLELEKRVRTFTGTVPWGDDVTYVVIRQRR